MKKKCPLRKETIINRDMIAGNLKPVSYEEIFCKCDEEKCEFWVTAKSTEGIEDTRCAISIIAMTNGRILV